MYTMNTSIIPDETYGYYPSEFIVGRHNSVPHKVAEICFREAMMLEFWRSVISFISQSTSGNLDGQVYTSDQMDVFLGPWDIDIRHHIETEAERRYDVNFGEYETVHVRDNESFEVVGAYDMDNDMNLPGIIYLLNDFYKKHQREIFSY